MSSQPSAMPRFSAAIDGWRIQSCSRFDALVVALRDLGGDRVVRAGRARGAREAEGRRRGRGGADEGASGVLGHAVA